MTDAVGTAGVWQAGHQTHRLTAFAAHWPAALVLVSGAMAFLWASALLIRRTEGLSTPAYDLAFFQQVIWNVGRDGHWISSFHNGSFLGLHFSPILVVPAMLERLLGADVRLLSVIHALAIGALAPATFLFTLALLRPAKPALAVAAGLAVMLPVSAAMQEVVRADFHPEAIGVVMALLAGWAGLTRRHRAMWAFAALALLTREDLGYAVAVVGLVIASRGRGPSRRRGLILVAVGVAWTGVIFGLVMPWFRNGAWVDTDRYYRWLGNGAGVLLAPFTQTDAVVAALTRPAPWFVAAGMLISLAGLPLLRPRWLLLVAPPLAATLLSAHPPQAALLLQYPLALVVPLTVAAAVGARRGLTWLALLRRRSGRRPSQRRWSGNGFPAAGSVVLATVLILPGAGVAFVQGSIPPFVNGYADQFTRPAGIAQLLTAAAAVPPEAPLFVDEGLAAVLANRTEIRLLTSYRTITADAFVLFEMNGWVPNARAGDRRNGLVQFLQRRPRAVIAQDGRFVLLGPERGNVP